MRRKYEIYLFVCCAYCLLHILWRVGFIGRANVIIVNIMAACPEEILKTFACGALFHSSEVVNTDMEFRSLRNSNQ